MRNVLLILFLFLANLSSAQVVFDKSYGGMIFSRFGRSIEPANNNGYLINASLQTGYINTVLYRINSQGDTLWTRRFGNDSIQFKTYETLRIANGGYLLCGDYQHINEPYSMDSYVMQIDSLGHIVWFNEYGITNTVGGKDYASNVIQLSNGNIVTTGLAKHSYTEVGTIQNYGYFQGYVHVFDSDGDSIRAISLVHYFTPSTQGWAHRYHGNDMAVSNDRICIVGERYPNYATFSLDTSFALILDENLDTVRCVTFPINRGLYSVDVTPQGTFMVFGDDVIAELDTAGNIVWQHQVVLNNWRYTKIGVRDNGEMVALESGDGDDIGSDVMSSNCNANGLVIIHTLDNSGNEISADTLSFMPASSKGMVDFILEGDSTITLTGGIGNLRMWLVQYNGRGHTMTNVQSASQSEIEIFPNPAQNNICISGLIEPAGYSILNAVGEIVLSSKFVNDQDKVDVSELPPGIYMIQVYDESGRVLNTSFIKQ